METKIAEDLGVEVFDLETDEAVEMTSDLRAEVERYVEQFRAEAKGTAPVGHHPCGRYLFEFTRRVSGCSQ